MSETISVRETIKNDFGIDLPISGGWGNSIDAAVVLHHQIPNDYVSVEYEYIGCIAKYSGFKWKLISQNLVSENNKRYDVIKIEAVAENDGEVRSKTMNFHFDITGCFDK